MMKTLKCFYMVPVFLRLEDVLLEDIAFSNKNRIQIKK